MIKTDDVINFIIEYKFDKKYTFYNDCIIKLKELQNKDLTEIKHESYILEPLRLFLINNKYNIYLDTKKEKNTTYIKFIFDDK